MIRRDFNGGVYLYIFEFFYIIIASFGTFVEMDL